MSTGLFAVSVNPEICDEGTLWNDLFWGTDYQQHLGQDFCGLAVSDGQTINCANKEGLFLASFSFKDDKKKLRGSSGIGYCGKVEEPFFTESRFGKIAICFSGNIINIEKLKEELQKKGCFLKRGDEVEVIERLISQEDDIVAGIEAAVKKIEGAFVLLILTKDEIYAVQCPRSTWPIVIGKKAGAVALASDPSGFLNLGYMPLRDLNPGEIVSLKNGKHKTIKVLSPPCSAKYCSFLWIYFLYPPATIWNVLVELVRIRIGMKRAKKHIKRGFFPDIVSYVPDSARAYAIGYLEEYRRQFEQGLIKKMPQWAETFTKYSYIGRSFIYIEKQTKTKAAFFKQIPIEKNLKGMVLVLWDDSTVFGSQMEFDLLPKVVEATNVMEIYIEIGDPEIQSFCPWGKVAKEESKATLFSVRCPTKAEKLARLNQQLKRKVVKDIEYSEIEDVREAIGIPIECLCFDCNLPSAV